MYQETKPLILHGPPNSHTGISYVRQYLSKALEALGHSVVSWSPDRPIRLSDGGLAYPRDSTWNIEGFHWIIEQPIMIDQAHPWHGCLPFFELPLRPDEQAKLRLGAPRLVGCTNPWMQQEIRNLNPAIDDAWFPLVQLGATPTSFSNVREKGSIVTVGKAEPRKGIQNLLQALKILKKTAYLAITSPLHTQLELERLQEYADADSHTLIHFSQTHKDVLALLHGCHVAVFPAAAEAWSLGLTESLAQGCVVVASDIPAFRYQYQLLAQSIGSAEADSRLILVPTHSVPMAPHQRWYPSMLYPGVQWLETKPEDLCQAIEVALSRPFPKPWSEIPGGFPLTWERSAQRLVYCMENMPKLQKQRRSTFKQ